MALTPIELLEQEVTPRVIPVPDPQGAHTAALSHLYAFFLALLSRNPGLASTLSTAGGNGWTQLLDHPEARQQLVQELARHHNLPTGEISRLASDALPLAIPLLIQQAGATGLGPFLMEHKASIVSRLPAWAAPILALLGLGDWVGRTSQAAVTAPSAPNRVVVQDRAAPPWLPWVGLLLLGLLTMLGWKACHHETVAPVASVPVAPPAPVQAASTVPASLLMTTGTGNEVFACRAMVGTEALRTQLMATIDKVFSGYNQCHIEVDSSYGNNLPTDARLENILSLVKGTPNASLQLQNGELMINAPDTAQRDLLIGRLKALQTDLSIIPAPALNVEQSVTDSIQSASTALQALDAATAKPSDVARALNLQIINFASDSADIPEINKPVLIKAAELINKVPNVQLTIQGHTDSTGDVAHNKELSQRRAQSVKDFLVAQGVAQAKLGTEGYGSEQPIADNVTELGKFKNRRIEFVVLNTATGTVRHVDEVSSQSGVIEGVHQDGSVEHNTMGTP